MIDTKEINLKLKKDLNRLSLTKEQEAQLINELIYFSDFIVDIYVEKMLNKK